MKKVVRTTLVLVVLAVAPAVQANLIQNGGFETGNLSGWSTWGAAPSVVTSLPGLLPHSGTYMARLGLDPYDATGSGFSQTLNLTAMGEYAEGYLGLSSDGAQWPSQSIAFQVGSSTGNFMQIALKGDGTVHYNLNWSQDAWGAPTIPALAAGDWLYAKFETVDRGGTPTVRGFIRDKYNNTYIVGNPYLGGGWEALRDITYVAGSKGIGSGNFPGGFDDYYATPEPATVMLLVLGGLVGLARRKR